MTLLIIKDNNTIKNIGKFLTTLKVDLKKKSKFTYHSRQHEPFEKYIQFIDILMKNNETERIAFRRHLNEAVNVNNMTMIHEMKQIDNIINKHLQFIPSDKDDFNHTNYN